MLISHISDVHIRTLSRHAEFKKILTHFSKDCKDNSVDHIFVGGDIFHQKTGISSEYVDFLSWWLNDMSEVAPVHLILGNHDGALTNLSRQDSVSPIVSALNNDKVHLYKNSGVYNFAPGYNFCVFSIFDEVGWKNVKPVPGEVNIACFHGPVRGSVTESGWDVEDGLSVEFFSDYQFAFLGDIHKLQYLGYRNEKPWIAYPGSPVQQNYAEEEKHGYLLWDIKNSNSWNVTFRELPNPCPYITVDWCGSTEKTLEEAKKFPEGSRFRIRSQVQLTQDDVHILSETLKANFSATEVTYKSEHEVDKNVVSVGSSIVAKTDLRSQDVIVRLMKDFYSTNSEVTASDISLMSDQVKTYMGSVNFDDSVARGSKWSLRKIEWDNLFSYGEGNSIDFEKLSGIVGIFGSNRTGKSGVVGSIMYTLFNTTDRGPIKNVYVCNARKPYCLSKAVFDHDGSTYVIERQTTKTTNKNKSISATTALNFFKVSGGEMVDLCGSVRTDTEKVIRSLIGSHEDFMMTSLSAQNETNQFISQGSSKRRSLLAKFLDLDIFDKLYDGASKEVSSLKSQLKNYPDKNWEELIKKNLETTLSNDRELKSLASKEEEAQIALNVLRQELSTHGASSVSIDDVNVVKRKVSSLKESSLNAKKVVEEEQKYIETLKEKVTVSSEIVNSIDVAVLKKKEEARKSLETSISTLSSSLDKETSTLDRKKKSLVILSKVPCGNEYPTCKFIKNAHEDKQDYGSQEKTVQKISKALEDAKTALKDMSDPTVELQIQKHEKAVDLLSKLELEISRHENKLLQAQTDYNATSASLVTEEERLRCLEEATNNQENVSVVSIRTKMKELSESIKEAGKRKLSLASENGKLSSDAEKLKEEKDTRDALLRKVRIHELVANAFSKKGLPLLVTKSQLPVINAEIAKILHGIVNFVIELEVDDETDALEIYIDYGDSRRIVELCSGMEKVVASIAIRVAMINVSSLPKPDFFIIDEGFGALDPACVEEFNRLLASLKNYFKTCIVITHVDGIKDAADHILEITKVEKDSKLEF